MHDHDFFTLETRDGVALVRFLDDRLLGTAVIEQLGQALLGLVESEGHDRIVLNLAKVEFLSSATINKILVLAGKAHRAGGSVHLCELRPNIRDIFRMTRLDQQTPIFETEGEAAATFARPADPPQARPSAG